MADDPAVTASPSRPTAHQLGPGREPETGDKMAGADAASDNLKGGGEDGNQDAASVKTTTADLFSEDGGAAAPSGPNSKQRHKLGLSITAPLGWDGSSYNDYDVVTVHGIRDDFKTAWTDARGGWWVKDRLCSKLSIREVDYSYEIDAASVLYEPNGITQHAQRLVTEYAALRQALDETETDRPIIWICHDLGGTIVKEALYMAMHSPAKYGKIAILTTAIIFLGTPHRFQSAEDPEDQLCKLLLLPGPPIRHGIPSKAKELARQVTRINQRFLSTKILDRAAVFNMFALNESEKEPVGENSGGTAAPSPAGSDEEGDAVDPVTPFPRYAHHVGHSFDAAGRYRHDEARHANLVRGEPSDTWVSWLSQVFNMEGFPLMVKYQILPFQAWLLSLAPPTRALDTPFDPVRSKPPVVTWIHDQGPYVAFSKPGGGTRLLHLHTDGNPLLDVASLSRLFYVDYDSFRTFTPHGRRPERTMVYFEFDRHDSRYNSISALLLYLLNAFVWRFWQGSTEFISEELAFLGRVHAWSLDDLYHLYSTFRRSSRATKGLSIFISCFDQCPADQQQWFLERVLEEQGYSDSEYRIVLSTSGPDDLVVASFPDDARINLDACPALSGSRDRLTEELRSGLSALIARRPVYGDFRQIRPQIRPQIVDLLEQCDKVPYLGRIILSWLGSHLRGKPRSEITDKISRLLPPTAENLVRVFITSLAPTVRTRAETVFNWVKHAAEPWSPESLTEALAVYESGGQALSFDDLDVDGTMREIEEALGGIITSAGGDVKFSHPSFYTVPEVGVEESGAEAVARANSTIAEACLRYFQLGCAQKMLAELSRENLIADGVLWVASVDSAVISHPRTSMAGYAVRFWHHHYEASGRFKPRELANDLFSNRQARAGWEEAFWLLSNPVTRMQRSYFSTLPVLARLGLGDLVQEKIQSERGQPGFNKDCWFAITEAARAGRKVMVQQLLGEVTAVDEEELPTAIHWAAGRGDAGIVNALLDKIPNLGTFRWPVDLMPQAAAAGLEDLLAAMSLSGCDINERSNSYWGAPPAVIVAYRTRVSTMEFLLSSDFKPDLSVKDTSAGDTPLTTAAYNGHPRIVEMLLRSGASVETKEGNGRGPAELAAMQCNHKALDILIKAGADFKSGTGGNEPALVAAAESGSQDCVRVLLAHQADPEAEYNGTTALYEAVAGNHLGVTRLLLTHEPKPDMDRTLEGRLKLLMLAVITGNTELVSLLIEHGARVVDFVDPNVDDLSKTPLSRACALGDLEMVKLLLANDADINYTGENSDAPLLTALYEGSIQVARHLLQDPTVDVKWAAGDGTTSLHVAFHREFDMMSELLRRGAPVNAHSTSYGTPLHAAAREDRPKAIERLLANLPKPEVNSVYEDGWRTDELGLTPLQLACMHHFPKCVKALLKGGANPSFKNRNGDDAVDVLLQAEKSDSNDAAECLRLLLSVPYNVSVDQVDEQGRTRLHGIREKTPVSIVQLLVEANAPLDVQDQEGHSPLSVAVNKGNEMVARYLVKQGVNLNQCGPGFGSILHLAVSKGDLDMAKFLVESGADTETVDPEYGESLLYTALGIRDYAKLQTMVRYLVDEARVPINKPGGAEFSYPIIRAADLARTDPRAGTQILKFLIRRKAQLDVADSQGRRAVHLACASWGSEPIRVLVEAGAETDVRDALGRKPIHFAASAMTFRCLTYLMDEVKDTDINEADYDKWSPLMWAARSGSIYASLRLVEASADVWARGRGADRARDEWSALRLLRFSDRTGGDEGLQLEPKDRSRVGPDGETEEWDDAFHEVEVGDLKDATCNSCFVVIRGTQWKCIDCKDDVSLCFKCFGYQSVVHNPHHEFEEIGPMYIRRSTSASPVFSLGNHSDDGQDGAEELPLDDSIVQALAQDTEGLEGNGDAAASPGSPSPSESFGS